MAGVADALRAAGRHVHTTAEPSKGPIGVLIRQMLGGDRARTAIHRELALLFAADRLDHMAREIEPQLAAGVDVVSDRYVLSSLVYQSLDLPLDWVRDAMVGHITSSKSPLVNVRPLVARPC